MSEDLTNAQCQFIARKARARARIQALIDNGKCPDTLREIESAARLNPRTLSYPEWGDVRGWLQDVGVLGNTTQSR